MCHVIQSDKGTCFCGGVAKRTLKLMSNEKGTKIFLCNECFEKSKVMWKEFILGISK